LAMRALTELLARIRFLRLGRPPPSGGLASFRLGLIAAVTGQIAEMTAFTNFRHSHETSRGGSLHRQCATPPPTAARIWAEAVGPPGHRADDCVRGQAVVRRGHGRPTHTSPRRSCAAKRRADKSDRAAPGRLDATRSGEGAVGLITARVLPLHGKRDPDPRRVPPDLRTYPGRVM